MQVCFDQFDDDAILLQHKALALFHAWDPGLPSGCTKAHVVGAVCVGT